jgi:hypothetical protein
MFACSEAFVIVEAPASSPAMVTAWGIAWQ